VTAWRTPDVRALVESANPAGRRPRTLRPGATDLGSTPVIPYRRRVRLADLTADQRRVVLALIAAAQEARERAASREAAA
jgi:hypothetical protein